MFFGVPVLDSKVCPESGQLQGKGAGCGGKGFVGVACHVCTRVLVCLGTLCLDSELDCVGGGAALVLIAGSLTAV